MSGSKWEGGDPSPFFPPGNNDSFWIASISDDHTKMHGIYYNHYVLIKRVFHWGGGGLLKIVCLPGQGFKANCR